MSDIDDLLTTELKRLPRKPSEQSSRSDKKRYSELMSAAVARALGEALRRKGLKGTLPLVGGESAPAGPQQPTTSDKVEDNGGEEEVDN